MVATAYGNSILWLAKIAFCRGGGRKVAYVSYLPENSRSFNNLVMNNIVAE